MKGDQLPAADHVSRYCKPSTVDAGEPVVSAFEVVGDATHLSVNWLESFGAADRAAQIEGVRKAFDAKGYRLRRNGRFAVLSVAGSKERIRAEHARNIDFLHWPEPDDESHAGIFGYGPDDLAIALELKNLVTKHDIFEATP